MLSVPPFLGTGPNRESHGSIQIRFNRKTKDRTLTPILVPTHPVVHVSFSNPGVCTKDQSAYVQSRSDFSAAHSKIHKERRVND